MSKVTDTFYGGGSSDIVTDNFLGGAEKKAGKAQERANIAAQAAQKKGTKKALAAAKAQYAKAEESRRAGGQAGLDIFAQSVPQQAQLFTQGNVGAQNALSGSLSRYRGDILGMQPQAAPQAQQFNFDSGFLPTSITDALSGIR
jgi:hypothetical protein